MTKVNNTVLIIDDDESQLKTLSDVLEIEGLKSIPCKTEDEALLALRKQDINVAILDLRLGKSDGLVLLKKLKKVNPELRIIINTAYATLESAMTAVNEEAFAYIRKMSEVDELLTFVHKAFYDYLEKHNKKLESEVEKQTKKLKKLNEQLESRVKKRTRDLEELVEELDSFAYSISHDLRTPLRHINGYSELLRDEVSSKINEKGKNYLDKIIISSGKMNELINDLLLFSRTSRDKLHYSRIELNEVVSDVIESLNLEILERNILWKIDKLPVINGDLSMITQVVYNLISNAIKFSRDRNPALIEIGSFTNENHDLVICIFDNGVGFDMTYKDKLFGVFQRLHKKEEFDGTGIGLSFVKRIINRHGGRVWAESEVNKGSVFYFSLPYKKYGD